MRGGYATVGRVPRVWAVRRRATSPMMSDPKREPHGPNREDDEEERVDDPLEYFTKVGEDDSPTSDSKAPPPG